MKKLMILTFALYGFTIFGQEKEIKKSESVIIYNNKIISKSKFQEYSDKRLIKTMNLGVTQKERDRLEKIFGKKIKDRKDIIKIDLYKERRSKKTNSKVKKFDINKNRAIELKLN